MSLTSSTSNTLLSIFSIVPFLTILTSTISTNVNYNIQEIKMEQYTNPRNPCHETLEMEPIRDSTVFLNSPINCINNSITGLDGSWSCLNTKLYSHISLYDLGCTNENQHIDNSLYGFEGRIVEGCFGNDIWGWTDPNNDIEYVLFGKASGLSIIDISDPLAPIVIAFVESLDPHPTIWRDIKTYGEYAYIVADFTNGHDLQIIHLPTIINRAWDYYGNNDEYGWYGGYNHTVFVIDRNDTDNMSHKRILNITACHNIFINQDTGYLYEMGCRNMVWNETKGDLDFNYVVDGGLLIYKMNEGDYIPEYINSIPDKGTFYTHDVQCFVYNGPDKRYSSKEICITCGGDQVEIINMEDKFHPIIISTIYNPYGIFAHQGWVDESQSILFVDDEADEFLSEKVFGEFLPYPRTYVYDITDLSNPFMIVNNNGEPFSSLTHTSIDHNHFIVGDYLYQAHYRAGLRIIDISDFLYNDFDRYDNFTNLTWNEVGYFDTHVYDDDVCFTGAWGVYPFFQSGIIAVSDITNGLFLLTFNDNFDIIESTGYSSTYDSMDSSVKSIIENVKKIVEIQSAFCLLFLFFVL